MKNEGGVLANQLNFVNLVNQVIPQRSQSEILHKVMKCWGNLHLFTWWCFIKPNRALVPLAIIIKLSQWLVRETSSFIMIIEFSSTCQFQLCFVTKHSSDQQMQSQQQLALHANHQTRGLSPMHKPKQRTLSCWLSA